MVTRTDIQRKIKQVSDKVGDMRTIIGADGTLKLDVFGTLEYTLQWTPDAPRDS